MRPRDPLADAEPLIRRVYAYVAYRIGDGPDAEDVTAEAFERAVRYRDSYDVEKGDPAAWVIGIARRVLVSRAVTQPAAPLDEERAAAMDDLETTALTRVALVSAVTRLGPRDRELIALRYGADLSAREIGRVLELKTNAVDVALHRALARLRTELESGSTMRSRAIAQPLAD
jgi:RNA polymerase sigma factor (sigma-70 family)